MWVIPAVMFYLWITGSQVSSNGLAFLVYWFSCLQSTPENFIIWIGLVKLFQIIYLRRIGAQVPADALEFQMIILRALWRQVGPRMDRIRLRIFVGRNYEQLDYAGELEMSAGDFIMLSQGKIQPEYEEDSEQ